MSASKLRQFLDRHADCALVEVAAVRGSVPREAGTWMLVAADAIFGTIGGGQLEYMAIDKARLMLARPGDAIELSVALGPEIGQCCGGRVDLTIRTVDADLRSDLLVAQLAEDASRPHVFVFGGGHVGHALAAALNLLPVHVIVVEARPDALDGMPPGVECRLLPMPEQAVRLAPSGSAYIILTHDHALDFLIVAEALKRTDAAYVGMIGSRTKRATFRSWYLKTAGGTEEAFARLVSPIGGDAVRDKRPAVIAAMATAEVMAALGQLSRKPLDDIMKLSHFIKI